jgi:GMP synthase (glutamine-hydrolysing)
MVAVTLTDAGKTDLVFSQLPSTFQVFQWHGEGIMLPPETKSLLDSADFPVQAFRAQERCYGLLFHPEMEEEGMQALCRECPEDVQKGRSYLKGFKHRPSHICRCFISSLID